MHSTTISHLPASHHRRRVTKNKNQNQMYMRLNAIVKFEIKWNILIEQNDETGCEMSKSYYAIYDILLLSTANYIQYKHTEKRLRLFDERMELFSG